ncbi:hypothetical protein SteCoe_2413 [Stentor coeruleus]|uniref:RRM domain-containing protein n=1 Tax=Stentor coeruleus TaxID=5963 RepID=A0A1R2CZH3_9CILI|nr:hypothetical protein SteCoe_2413 [Stentor coeruleus]
MEDSVASRKIFIGGLSPQTTKESLRNYFSAFGDVQDCILMADRATGRSRCFGFITMKDPSEIEKILSQDHNLDGKKIDCKQAVPREAATNPPTLSQDLFKTKKMFVGGLPQDVTEELFKGFFEQFGEVEDSVVMLDRETGRPRGFGFVTFKSEDSADKVLENHSKNYINGKWVECKKATPKQNPPASHGQNSYAPAYMMYPYNTQANYPYYYDYPRFEYNPLAIFTPNEAYNDNSKNL